MKPSFTLSLILAAPLSPAAFAAAPVPPVAAGCPTSWFPTPYVGSPAQKAAIRSAFNRVILCNLQHNPNANAVIAGMGVFDLARLSTQFDLTVKMFPNMSAGTVPKVADFLQVSAQRLNTANLKKIRSAFGGTETDAAVAKYASYSIQSAYFSGLQAAPLKTSRAQILSIGGVVKQGTVTVQGTVVGAPVLDMTLYEIYLEYATASGVSSMAAMASAAEYIGGQVTFAFSAGYLAGTGIYYVVDKVDPDITRFIGDEIGPIGDWICKGGECK